MHEALEFLRENHGVWSLVVVFIAAVLEYVVPPLPADSVVLASSLLIVAGVYRFEEVYAVAVVGGLFGSLVHFVLGRAVQRGTGRRVSKLFDRLVGPDSLERFYRAFRKYGMWVMALNRGVPGVRGVAFIAAGAAGLPLLRTMLFGLISNLGWTFLILYLGVSVGGHWEKIERAQSVYARSMYVIAAVGLGLYVGYRVVRWRRHRSRRAA